MPKTSEAASGCSRGRGWLNRNATSNGEARPGDYTNQPEVSAPVDDNPSNTTPIPVVNSSYLPIVQAIKSFDCLDDGILINQKFRIVKQAFIEACETSADAEQAFEYVYNEALSDCHFMEKFVIYVSLYTFRELTIADLKLRSTFLSMLQKNYNNAAAMHATSPHKFRNAVQIIAGFYKKAILGTVERNYKVLAPAILHCISILLESDDSNDIVLFSSVLFTCGEKFIADRIDLTKVTNKLRMRLASNTDALSKTCKLWLLFTMDFSNNNFRGMPRDLVDFYQKNLFNIENPLTPLIIDCTISSINDMLNEFSSDFDALQETAANVSNLHVEGTNNESREKFSPSSAMNRLNAHRQ